jgi:hypothetical protein
MSAFFMWERAKPIGMETCWVRALRGRDHTAGRSGHGHLCASTLDLPVGAIV